MKENDLFTFFLTVLFCSIVHSCADLDPKNKLEWALSLAGENRVELEKVLKNYSKNPQDSLKYKAACFLIENMPYYYYYEGSQQEDYLAYYRLLREKPLMQPSAILDSLKHLHGQFSLQNLEIKYDINEVDSSYLHDNIEWSFKVWKEQPWGKYVSFENFCEFILPYRLGNEKLTS